MHRSLLLPFLVALVFAAIPSSARAVVPSELDAAHDYGPWHLADGGFGVDVRPAWAAGLSGAGAVVAVLDTGAQLSHPELVPALWTNPADPPNGRDDDHDGFVDDVHGADFVNDDGDPSDDAGHGTQVAGAIVAAVDDRPALGVAPGARLMVLKVADNEGLGTVAAIGKALDYAAVHGATVANISLGTSGSPAALDRVFARARAAGILVVVAAGNEGFDLDHSPATIASSTAPNVLTVGSIERSGQWSDWSSYGAVSVDLAAPGDAILTTDVDVGSGLSTDVPFSGTSAAAPLAAGAAALLHERAPFLGPAALRGVLMRGAVPTPSIAATPTLTARAASGGRLDIGSALAALPADLVPPSTPSVSGGRLRQDRTGKVTLSGRRAVDAGGPVSHELVVDGQPVRLTGTGGAAVLRGAAAATGVGTGEDLGELSLRGLTCRPDATDPQDAGADVHPPAQLRRSCNGDGHAVPRSNRDGNVAVSRSVRSSSGSLRSTVQLARGRHLLSVLATDAAGNQSRSATVTVQVLAPKRPARRTHAR